MPDFERIVDDLAEEKPPSLWTTHEICAVQTVWRNRGNVLCETQQTGGICLFV